MKGLLLMAGRIREENKGRFTCFLSPHWAEVRAGNDSIAKAESPLFQLRTQKSSLQHL